MIISIALGIVLAVILLITIDIWLMPVLKIIGILITMASMATFIWFVAILSGG